MSGKYELLLKTLKNRNLSLEAYQEYLAVFLEKPYHRLTQQLREKKIDLLEYQNYLTSQMTIETVAENLQNGTASKDLESSLIESLGCHLLKQKRILLDEINQILKELKWLHWDHFLIQLFRYKKITLEEFIEYRQSKIEFPPAEEYRLQIGKIPAFYAETAEDKKKYGSYILLEELGKGGMGVVYKAYHSELNQIVALKLLHSKSKVSEKGRSRFLREIQIMAKLKHENIVQIYDSGEQAGQIYLTMEYIDGQPLEEKRKELTLREKLQILEKLLGALAYAHEQNIIHRDLKLENILLTRDLTPKIADFGLAKELDEEQEKLTESGILLGTVHYMAPEQAHGNTKEIDNQTDIYAMGVCLYRLLTQKFPFEGKTINELLSHIVNREVIPPSKHCSELHQDVDYVVLKALEREKEARYKNAKAFSEDIHCILEGLPIEGRKTTIQQSLKKWRRKNKKKMLLSSVSMIVLLSLPLIGYVAKKLEAEREFEMHYKNAKSYRELAKGEKSSETTSNLLKAFHELKEALKKKYKKSVEQERWTLGKELIFKGINITEENNLVEYVSQELEHLKSIEDSQKKELRVDWTNAKQKQGIHERRRFSYWVKKLKNSPLLISREIGNDALYEIFKMSDPEVLQEIIRFLIEGDKRILIQGSEPEADFYTLMVTIAGRMQNRTLIPILIQPLKQVDQAFLNDNEIRLPFYKKKYLVCILQALSNLKANEKEYERLYYNLQMKLLRSFNFKKSLSRSYKNLFSSENLSSIAEEDFSKYFERALKKALLQDYSGSISDYTHAIRLNPQFVDAYINRGVIKQERGDLEGALFDFNEAIRLNPQSLSGYNNRGFIKKKRGDLEGALLDFNETIRLDPHSSNSYLNRGITKQAKGDSNGAILDYNEAIRLNPQEITAYNNRGLIKKRKGDLEGALEDYTAAIRVDSQFILAYSNRGAAKQEKGDFAGALLDFDESIRIDPQSSDSYYNRGIAKRQKKDLEGAILDFTEAIRLNPQSSQAYSNRGGIKQEKGDSEEAILDYTEAIRLNPKSPNNHFNRGAVRHTQRDFSSAILDFTETIRLNPQDSFAYYYRGLCQLNVENTETSLRARTDFKQFLELTKNGKEASIQQMTQHILQVFPDLGK